MKLKQIMNFEMNKDKKSSIQMKAIKALIGFLILMFLLTILSRIADSLTIAKVKVTTATGNAISHVVEAEGTISANKDISISTSGNIKIAAVEVTEGKSVKKGDLLIQLDTDDIKKKLLQAQKDLEVLKATASDKEANKAIEESNKQRSMNRTYEDYNQTIANANDSVSKAKQEMDKAWGVYAQAKNNSGGQVSEDTTVYEALTQTVTEKQVALDRANALLDGAEKDIEAMVQKAIDKRQAELDQAAQKSKASNETASSETMTTETAVLETTHVLTLEEKQAIREEVNALPENKEKLESAQADVAEAQTALSEAQTALSVYESERSQNNQHTDDEQLKALYDDYTAKKEMYNEALKQKDTTVRDANRILEDAKAPENVDTASSLTENNDLELKQLEVDKLQEVMDADGKITAPTDGLVTKVLVTTGESTTEDTAIRMADQTSGYKFSTTLDKISAKYIKKGDKVSLDIGGGTTVDGLTIDSLDMSTTDKNTYELSISIPAKVTNLGSIATMKADKASKKYDTCVPLNTLHSDGNKYYVYVVNQKDTILGTETAVDKVDVEVIDKNNELAAIEGAFGWNQQFVISSSKTLRDGDRVRVLEDN